MLLRRREGWIDMVNRIWHVTTEPTNGVVRQASQISMTPGEGPVTAGEGADKSASRSLLDGRD